MTTPEDTELREMLELNAETIETDDGEYLAVDIDKAMNLITLHTQDLDSKARLNELTHRANDAIERMYRLDREYAGNYIQSMREFYPI